jgi:hypothetical protein
MADREIKVKIRYASEGASEAKGQWQDVMKGFVAGNLVIGSLTKAFDFLKDTIVTSFKAYDDEIQQLTRLKANLGAGAEEVERFAQAQSKITRYSKDEIVAVSNLLATHKLNSAEIKKLIPVIQDYSAKSGRGLTETAYAFAMAIQYGTTRGLKPFGLELDKDGSQMEMFNNIVKAGEGNAKGMAEAFAKQGVGSLVQFKNEMSMVYEILGEKVSPLLIAVTEKIKKVVTSSSLSQILEFNTRVIKGENVLKAARATAVSDIIRQAKEEKDLNKLFNYRKQILLDLADLEMKPHFSKDKANQLREEFTRYGKAAQEIVEANKKAREEEEKKSGLDTVSEEEKNRLAEEEKRRLAERKKNLEDYFKSRRELFMSEEEKEIDDENQKYLKLRDDNDENQQAQLAVVEAHQAKLAEIRKKYAQKEEDEILQARESIGQAEENAYQQRLTIMEQVEGRAGEKNWDAKKRLFLKHQGEELSWFKKGTKERLKVEEQQAEDLRQFEIQEFQSKAEMALSTTNMMLGSFEKVGEAMGASADEMKEIRMGEAIIAGAQAAIQALALPFPVNWIQEMAILAETGAQMALIQQQKFNKGGVVQGGVPGVDSVPALLTPGEIVFNPANPNSALASMITNNTGHTFQTSISVQGNASPSTVKSIESAVYKSTLQALKKAQNLGHLSAKGLTVRN